MTRCTKTWIVFLALCLLSGCFGGLPGVQPTEEPTEPIIAVVQIAVEQWPERPAWKAQSPHTL